MMYCSWDMKHDKHNFLSFWTIFAHLPALNNLENQSFEKNKKNPGDVITLHLWAINENDRIYGSWNMECDRHDFLSFWTIFCPFTPLNNLENQNDHFLPFYPSKNPEIEKFEKKNMKIKPGDIISLHMRTINDIWFLRYEVWQNFCLFCAIFFPFTPLTTQKLKVLKWKKHLELLSFYT